MGDQQARTATRTVSNLESPGKSNDRWLTPKPIIDAVTVDIGLPRFDLDPCGAPGHDTAQRVYTLEAGDDGLRDPWWGRVYCNPPYGAKNILPWVNKMMAHVEAGGSWTMLIPADVGQIGIWQDRALIRLDAVMFWRHRIDFWSRDDVVGNMPSGKRMTSMNASAIVAFGDLDADALVEATKRDLLPGVTYRIVHG